MFLVDINFFGVLFWPGVDGGSNSFAILTAHVTAVVAAGLFSALAIAAIHGIIATVFRGRLYRRVSVTVQTLLMFTLVMLLVLTPLIAGRTEEFVKQNSAVPLLVPRQLGLSASMSNSVRSQRAACSSAWERAPSPPS